VLELGESSTSVVSAAGPPVTRVHGAGELTMVAARRDSEVGRDADPAGRGVRYTEDLRESCVGLDSVRLDSVRLGCGRARPHDAAASARGGVVRLEKS